MENKDEGVMKNIAYNVYNSTLSCYNGEVVPYVLITSLKRLQNVRMRHISAIWQVMKKSRIRIPTCLSALMLRLKTLGRRSISLN